MTTGTIYEARARHRSRARRSSPAPARIIAAGAAWSMRMCGTTASCASRPMRDAGNRSIRRSPACARGIGQIERTYHPDRLQYPQRRVGPRGSGQFERISWDEALDEVAREMRRVRAILRQCRDPRCVAHRHAVDAAWPCRRAALPVTCSAAAPICGRTCRPRPRCSPCASPMAARSTTRRPDASRRTMSIRG